MRAGRVGRVGLLVVVSAVAPAAARGGGDLDLRAALAGPSPIALENARAGDPGWRLARPAGPGQLEAYVAQPSAAAGEQVTVHARADRAGALSWRLFRMGWYGGAEARRVAAGGPVAVGPQPTPAADPVTGLVACAWPATFTVRIDPAWTTGVYLFVLTRDDGVQTHAILVVRDDARRGAAVLQAAFTTYQAYNVWGGRSAYRSFAPELSFDRPYAEGAGAGQYFRWEHDLVRWAEWRGYDLVYATSLDLDRDPGLLDGQRLFLSVGHDEYWTRAARLHLEAALGRGTSAAFLGGNAVYWQIRLEPSRDGAGRPRRTQVCYKREAASDPRAGTPEVTVTFRDPLLGWPENALLGAMYAARNDADAPAAAWVVRGADHWAYEGTGVADGDVIPGIVGYEVDRISGNGLTPPGTVALARSPFPLAGGGTGTHEAAVHERPSGAFVFAAGSNHFAWGLSREGVADARVQRLVENLFRRAGLEPGHASPPPFGPPDPRAGHGPAAAASSGGCDTAAAGGGLLAIVVVLAVRALAGLAARGARRRATAPPTPTSPRPPPSGAATR